MRIIDITRPIRPGMAVWPGDPQVDLEPLDGARVFRLTMGNHTGTHVDAPSHFLAGGADAATLSLEALIGEAEVWDISAVEGTIELEHLKGRPLPKRLLLRTRQGRDPVVLSGAAANYLVAGGISLVGVEGLSVDSIDSEEHPAHRALLTAGVVIIEGLNLEGVPPGTYRLVCLPLPLVGADGAPARAVLMADEGILRVTEEKENVAVAI